MNKQGQSATSKTGQEELYIPLPPHTLPKLQALARERGVTPEKLAKTWIRKRLREER